MRADTDDYVSLRFPAAVTDPSAPAEVYVEIRFKKYDVTSLDIRLGVIGDDRDHRIRVYSELMHPEWNYFWLYAKPPHARSVQVLGLRGVGGEGGCSDELHAVIPRASGIAVGIPTAPYVADTKVSFSADLTPSGILQGVGSLTFMGDGSIRRRELEKGEIVVTVGGGTLRAREWYDAADADEFGNSGTKLVQRAILSGEVVVPAGMSLTSRHVTLQAELSDICTVLSLCYRVSVNYYQITYHETPDEAPITESFLRRRIPRVTKRPIGRHELINFRALRQGGLDTLVRSFRESKVKEEIASAIHFLASSYGTDSLEAAYFLAFSGLEAAVGAAGP